MRATRGRPTHFTRFRARAIDAIVLPSAARKECRTAPGPLGRSSGPDKRETMPNLIHSARHAFPSMCEGQAKVYLERTIPSLFRRQLAHSKLWTMIEGERYFDVYQVSDQDAGRKEQFYFDVSAFFCKPDLVEGTQWRDLPQPNQCYELTSIIGEDELSSIAPIGRTEARHWISDYTVTFKQFSSEQIGHRVVSLSSRARSFEVSPVRMYVNRDIPFLHGYRFYKLFMVHQIIHWFQGHDTRMTELGPRRDGRLPVPGVDCIQFEPLPPYDFARDFINFMFWNHQPDAFDHRAEIEAFAQTVRYGIRSELFTPEELRAALRAARPSAKVQDILSLEIRLLGSPRPPRQAPALSLQIAH